MSKVYLHDFTWQQTEHERTQTGTQLNAGLEVFVQLAVIGIRFEIDLQTTIDPISSPHI